MAKDLNYTLSLKDLFSKQMRSAEASTSRMDKTMSSLQNKLAGLGAGLSIGVFGKAVFDSLRNYEYFSSSLRTLMDGDKMAAKALEGQLINLAAQTPFSLIDVQDSTKKLLAYGFAAGDVVRTMKMLGDVSSGTGNAIGDVAYLYGTLRTQGKAMTKDLYQFTNRGINLLPQLAKQFGVTEDKIYDLASAGKISFSSIEKAFISMTSQGGKFFGMMDEQSKTVGGRWSNLSDTWEQIRVNIVKSQTGIISGTIGFLSEISKQINDKLSAENFMKEAFTKGAATSFDISSSLYGKLPFFKNIKSFSGDYNKSMETALYVQSLIDSSTSGLKAQQSLSYVELNKNKLKESLSKGEISKEEYRRQVSLFNMAYSGIIGQMKNLSSKGKKASGLDENGNKISELGLNNKTNTGVNISANRPQSLIININEMVHDLKITASNLTESTVKIKEEVSKIFLELVNDANLSVR